MKLLFASDIHGNLDNLKILIKIIEEENVDKIIILGDTFSGHSYHDSFEMMNLLSKYTTKLYILKGNCDTSFMENMSPVGFLKELKLNFHERTIYCNHGHLGIPSVNFKEGDIYCFGHTHINKIEDYHGIIFCNPGSVSLPRANTKQSYMIIDDEKITIYDLKKQVLHEKKLK